MAQRIRGQEVTVNFLPAGEQTWQSLNDIRSFSVTPKFTKLEEQYLGGTSKRYDEIFDGLDFDMELHLEDPNALNFITLIRERAIDRKSQTKVNIVATLKFSDGTLKLISLLDCYFENMPLNVGSRSDYVTLKLSGSCENFTIT